MVLNVLALAPHPDDESLGCGGALALHGLAGDRTTAVFLTSGQLGLKHLDSEQAIRIRESEAREAAAVLGLAATSFLRMPDWMVEWELDEAARRLAPCLTAEQPDVVYVPHPADGHPDHAASLSVLRRALVTSGGQPELRTYEIWTPMSTYEQVVDVALVMERKLEAVRRYRSQLAGLAYDDAIRGLNRYRGALAGRCAFAEVFGAASPDGTW